MGVRFVWDARKAAANLRKHGVTFEEATTRFMDPLALVADDATHPQRSRIIGEPTLRHILVTVFVEAVEDDIRIVSVRRATRGERRRYEEGQEA